MNKYVVCSNKLVIYPVLNIQYKKTQFYMDPRAVFSKYCLALNICKMFNVSFKKR